MIHSSRPTPKAQSTRRSILNAALQLFAEQGFETTSMRLIAERAQMSVGSTYYYFRSKDELVLAYYAETHGAAVKRNQRVITETNSFEHRLRDLITFKLEQLAPSRPVVTVLARNAVDPKSPLSPFHAATQHLRQQAIDLIAQAIEGSDLRVHPELTPHLPHLLWLYQMGVIFFWVMDPSAQQQRTQQLIDSSLSLLLTLLKLTNSKLPGVKRLNSTALALLKVLVQENEEQNVRESAT